MDDPFKNHLFAILSSNGNSRTAHAQISAYEGPRDAQIDFILSQVEHLLQVGASAAARVSKTKLSLSICPTCSSPAQEPVTSNENSGGPPSPSSTSRPRDDVENELQQVKNQMRDVARVCKAMAVGDLKQKLTTPVQGKLMNELKQDLNSVVDNMNSLSSEVMRISSEIGIQGQLGGQVSAYGAEGAWREMVDNLNTMAATVTQQVRSVSETTRALATGDLTMAICTEANGEWLDLKVTINSLLERLRLFADEILRITLEVGVEGRFGGQVEVPDMEGTWEQLTNNINRMVANLTVQLRSISFVIHRVGLGHFDEMVDVQAWGEMLSTKLVVSEMVTRLRHLCSELIRVTQEIGREGRLGGQAHVEGFGGTWAELVDGVNEMTTNLTNQLRATTLVMKGVASGDCSKTLEPVATGELRELELATNGIVLQFQSLSNGAKRAVLEGKTIAGTVGTGEGSWS
ncbi:Hybrid signal transduction histidine kinase J [Mycena indigotica]|uniref:Hybrid signal transduction histidine kinase J n=1 Tax=Mycena indigotica TaxID=2126181 RepID=A0A8H6VUQ3_9AGAR|nr:Hybrid signal transduction histidine kinase J [Mycena indigotica]KAF7290793.1 Hybrid signal transduction histidine kinase J [Mycena indigotica]